MGPINIPDLGPILRWAVVGFVLTVALGVVGVVWLAVFLAHHVSFY